MKEKPTHRGKNFTQVGDKQWRRHLTQIQSVVSFVFIITENFATTGKLTCRFNWIFFPLYFNHNLLVALFVSLKGKKLKMHYGLQKLIVYCLEFLLLRDTTKFHKIASYTWDFQNFTSVFTILVKFDIHFLGLPWEIFFGVITDD